MSKNNNRVYSYRFSCVDKYWGQTSKTMAERERAGYPGNPELEKALEGPHETIVHYDGISDEAADFREREGIAETHTMVYEGGFNRQTGGKRGFSVVRVDSVPVLAIDKETQTARGWYPTEAMAERATGVPRQNVRRNVKRLGKSAGGCIWKSANRDWYETAIELPPLDDEE